MNRYLLLLHLLLCSGIANAQLPSHQDVATTDLTRDTLFNAEHYAVFGVYLGMDQKTAQETLKENPLLLWEVDEKHGTNDFRIYVYANNDGNKGEALLYLIWSDAQENLNWITFFAAMEQQVVGGTKHLFSKKALNKKSNVRTEFLGDPKSSETTLHLPSLNYEHITHYYPNMHLQLIEKRDKGKVRVIFAFVQ